MCVYVLFILSVYLINKAVYNMLADRQMMMRMTTQATASVAMTPPAI